MGLDIAKRRNDGTMTIELSGRLDTNTAPELEAVVKQELDDVTELVLDVAGLKYISSAGLRVVLAALRVMNRQGSMVVRKPNADIMSVFELTGFTDILTIEV